MQKVQQAMRSSCVSTNSRCFLQPLDTVFRCQDRAHRNRDAGRSLSIEMQQPTILVGLFTRTPLAEMNTQVRKAIGVRGQKVEIARFAICFLIGLPRRLFFQPRESSIDDGESRNSLQAKAKTE